jgi:hypothetical protein
MLLGDRRCGVALGSVVHGTLGLANYGSRRVRELASSLEAGPLWTRLSVGHGGVVMRSWRYVVPVVAVLVLAIAAGASGFVISHASSRVVQPQPAAGSCHARGRYPFVMSDLRCTPGALNPAVTQATISKTICHAGYSSRIRPSTNVTEPEKLASIRRARQPRRRDVQPERCSPADKQHSFSSSLNELSSRDRTRPSGADSPPDDAPHDRIPNERSSRRPASR